MRAGGIGLGSMGVGAASAGHGARDDAFVMRVRESLAGIKLPPGRGA